MFILLSSLCSAQVGIGTTNPQKELHVAGANSTIRIVKLNSFYNPDNDGLKPAKVFVDGRGDLAIGDGSGSGNVESLNFLIVNNNFIIDNPNNWNTQDEINNTGVVINNDTIQSTVEGELVSVTFAVPNQSLVEVKYGITLYCKGENMKAHAPPYVDITPGEAINMVTYFRIDINGDGWDGDEWNKTYGEKGQYHETQAGGISGFPYMNGQGYFSLPEGTHKIYFYGVVNDHEASYTSVGFGGLQDYLKIRIYN